MSLVDSNVSGFSNWCLWSTSRRFKIYWFIYLGKGECISTHDNQIIREKKERKEEFEWYVNDVHDRTACRGGQWTECYITIWSAGGTIDNPSLPAFSQFLLRPLWSALASQTQLSCLHLGHNLEVIIRIFLFRPKWVN